MDSIEYRQVDQQASAVGEIARLLPLIKTANGVQDILLAMTKTLEAQSYDAGDDMSICAQACRMSYHEIRDQLDGEPESAAEALSERAHNCTRGEMR